MKRLNLRLRFGLLLVGMMVASAGCGVQSGRFVTTGNTGCPLLSPVGSIDIVDGYERKAALVNDEHLLYILIVTPAVHEHGSDSGSDYDKYVTTLSHTWNTERGSFSVSIFWDRQTDVVTIGSQQFNRSNGDVFVVHLDTHGSVSGQQLPNIASHSNCRNVLRYIQEKLPNDKLVSSIQLYK